MGLNATLNADIFSVMGKGKLKEILGISRYLIFVNMIVNIKLCSNVSPSLLLP